MYDLNKTEKVKKLAQVDFMLTQCVALLAQYYDGFCEIPDSVYDNLRFALDYIECEAEVKHDVDDMKLHTMGRDWWLDGMYC